MILLSRLRVQYMYHTYFLLLWERVMSIPDLQILTAGRPGGSVGNLGTFRRWDVKSNLGAVTRTRIFPHI